MAEADHAAPTSPQKAVRWLFLVAFLFHFVYAASIFDIVRAFTQLLCLLNAPLFSISVLPLCMA